MNGRRFNGMRAGMRVGMLTGALVLALLATTSPVRAEVPTMAPDTPPAIARVLFYEVLPGLEPGQALLVDIIADGKPFLVEEIQPAGQDLEPAGEPAVVELLSRHQQHLQAVREAAAEGRKVTVQVMLDDQLLEITTLAELEQRHQDLLHRPAPLPARTTTRLVEDSTGIARAPGLELPDPGMVAAPGAAKAYACVTTCERERRDCYRSCGNPRLCLDDCDADYHTCLYQLCDCYPTRQTVVTSERVYYAFLGDIQCYYRSFYGGSFWHEKLLERFKFTEKEIVTNPDCSTEETILRVWYEEHTCYLFQAYSCANGSWPSNLCS